VALSRFRVLERFDGTAKHECIFDRRLIVSSPATDCPEPEVFI
jgi:hypothetical protein